MNNRKTIHTLHDRAIARVATPDSTPVPKLAAPELDADKPSKAVEQRFAKLHAEVFDGSGRLRAAYRPKPKPASPKKPESMFTINMDGGSAKLRPFIS